MRELRIAQIEDDVPLELHSAMEKLTTVHLTERLNRMLEADASVANDETSAKLMHKFGGGGRTVQDEYVPLRNDDIKDALRLPLAA